MYVLEDPIMIGSPSLENDIRARAAVLTDAILATNPHNEAFLQLREEMKQELADVALPPDYMTWFAVQRVAVRAGATCVWFNKQDTFVPHGALVVIAPTLAPPETQQAESTVASLKRAGFVIAPVSWDSALRNAGLAGLCISEPAREPGPIAESMPPSDTTRRSMKP
jgi:hypothetical protein